MQVWLCWLELVFGVGLAIFRDQLSSTFDRLGQRNMIDYEFTCLFPSVF